MNILTELEKLDTDNRILKIRELIDNEEDNISILKEIKKNFKSDFEEALIESATECIVETKQLLKDLKEEISKKDQK
jgi:hypothetical protein